MLICPEKCGKLMTVGGYVVCPSCLAAGRAHKLLRLLPDTAARNLPVYCRKCKREIILNIDIEAEAHEA